MTKHDEMLRRRVLLGQTLAQAVEKNKYEEEKQLVEFVQSHYFLTYVTRIVGITLELVSEPTATDISELFFVCTFFFS